MTSLREQLGGGTSVPEFRMLLPPGWDIFDTTPAAERDLLAKARARLRDAHMPEAYASLATHVGKALADARKQGAFMMILPGEGAPAWATVPVTILGSVTSGSAEASLDQLVADAVEHRGARALDGSRHFLRWADRRRVRLDGEEVGVYTVVYLTPVPGTRRGKALQLTATLVHAPEVDPEADEFMSMWLAALDAHLSTFAWTGR